MTFKPFSTAPAPFTIGLKPLGEAHPLHIDGELQKYRAEKICCYESIPQKTVMAEPDTIDAQREAANHIYDWIGKSADDETHVERFQHLGPLAVAALAVQDDLVLMRRDESGWRLVAASLCFPSSWTLAEKFSQPLEAIHAPVPHLQGKTGERIRRIFDSLRPETPLWRENWSIESDDNLRHERRLAEQSDNYKADKLSQTVFMRCEYQTLHKLPVSGDILFTIKILSRSIPHLAGHENGKIYLAQLLEKVANLDPAGAAYKGISGQTERFEAILRSALDSASHIAGANAQS